MLDRYWYVYVCVRERKRLEEREGGREGGRKGRRERYHTATATPKTRHANTHKRQPATLNTRYAHTHNRNLDDAAAAGARGEEQYIFALAVARRDCRA